MITNNIVRVLMLESMVIAIILIAIAFCIAYGIYRMESKHWNGFWKSIERNLSALFGFTWVLGFCTYCVGMYIKGKNIDVCSWDSLERLFRVAPMGVIHAFEMFLLESDISAIHGDFHGNLYFMTWFSTVHFLAALVSLMFVIKHFGYNIVARVQLLMASWSKTECLYIFWGMNDPSYYLAKDINEQALRQKLSHSSYRILFIKTEDNEDDTGNRTGLDRLFNFLSLKNKELDKLKELNCLSTTAFYRLSKCEITEDNRKNGCSILKNLMGLRRVCKLLSKTTSEVHIFILSEDEDNNIEATSNICYDNDIQAFAKKDKKVKIYCHARYDSINRVVEDAQSNKNIEVRIVDSAHNCINELRSKEEYHPINFVTIDTKDNIGTVKDTFTCMVIGFGETGQDAAKFLYEFSAFVSNKSSKEEDIPGENNSNIKIERSPFKCHIVDSNMDKIKGRFLASVPALTADNIRFNNRQQMEFHSFDVQSEEFYALLKANSDKLNYIVVSLKDDELTITTAVRIFNYIRKNRKDLTKFKIFVRCHNTLYEQHMLNIAQHYNQMLSKEHKTEDECIVIYGAVKTLYTYNQVINNIFEEEGKEYNHAYCKVSGKKGEKDVWESRHNFFVKENSLDGYSELRRKENQDVANAYHALTKIAIIKEVCKQRPNDTPNLQRVLNGNAEFIPIFKRLSLRGEKIKGYVTAEGNFTDIEQLLFRNIARLEHLRWNASHEMLGYCHFIYKENIDKLVEKEKERHGCKERYKVHNCILSWEHLDKESDLAGWGNNQMPNNIEYPDYKLYDYNVITTTLNIYTKNKILTKG